MPNSATAHLIGHAVREPELSYTPSNTPVCKFAIGVNRTWKSQGGEKQSEASFFDIEAWGKTAEVLNQYVGKGDPIYLVCEPRQDRWQDRDGNNRSKVKFVVQQFQFLGGRDGGGKSQQRNQGQPSQPAPPDEDSDIPF